MTLLSRPFMQSVGRTFRRFDPTDPYWSNSLQFYVPFYEADQQGFLLSKDGNDKLAAAVAQLRPLDSSGTYEITGFKSSSTANNQTLIASCDTGTTTTFFHIYVASTTGRLTISTQENNGTVNTVSGTTNVCSGARIPTMQVKSSGTAWSFVVNGVLDTPIVVAGANTGDWLADIGLVAPRDNVTHGVKTTTGDGSWAIAEMGQHRLYSVAISDAECATNNSRGWKATPFDSTYVVYNLPCQEGTGNPVETVAAVNPTLTGATWVEGLIDRSPNAVVLTSFGSPVWSNQGRTFDGTDDWMQTDDSNALDITSALTVAAWINPTVTGNSQYRTILSKRIGATSNYQLYLSNAAGANAGVLVFFCVSTNTTTYVPVVGTWILVVATVVGGVSAVYINGDSIFSGANTLADNTSPLRIGRSETMSGSDLGWYGKIGEVFIYNKAWAPQEVRQIYNATKWRYV